MRYLLDANVMITAQEMRCSDWAMKLSDWASERGEPSGSIRKVKIPDVCIGLGIKCMTPFQMLRLEGARFVLESAC